MTVCHGVNASYISGNNLAKGAYFPHNPEAVQYSVVGSNSDK